MTPTAHARRLRAAHSEQAGKAHVRHARGFCAEHRLRRGGGGAAGRAPRRLLCLERARRAAGLRGVLPLGDRGGVGRLSPCAPRPDLQGGRHQGVLREERRALDLRHDQPAHRQAYRLRHAVGQGGAVLQRARRTWATTRLPYYEEPPESPVSTPEVAKEYPYILITGGNFRPMFHSENRQLGHRHPGAVPRPDHGHQPRDRAGARHRGGRLGVRRDPTGRDHGSGPA